MNLPTIVVTVKSFTKAEFVLLGTLMLAAITIDVLSNDRQRDRQFIREQDMEIVALHSQLWKATNSITK